jgi:hypothetical protein
MRCEGRASSSEISTEMKRSAEVERPRGMQEARYEDRNKDYRLDVPRDDPL